MKRTPISHATCDRIRRLVRRGYMAKTIQRELPCDPATRTIYNHARGDCNHVDENQGEEPPVSRKEYGELNTDPTVPALEDE